MKPAITESALDGVIERLVLVALPGDLELLFLAGQRPIIATKLRYFADREFAGAFDPA